MRAKSWLRYLLCGILIFGLIILERYADMRLSHMVADPAILKFFYLRLVCIMGFGLMVGTLLGLDVWLINRKKSGRWHFNWPKAVLLCLPALFLIILPYFTWQIPLILVIWANVTATYSLDFLYVVSILFGYCFITSFYKQNKTAD